MTLIQPDMVLHDSRGHLWRTAPSYQDRVVNAPGWLLLQRLADRVEMPYARVVDVFGYGEDANRYLLARYDQAAARLAAGETTEVSKWCHCDEQGYPGPHWLSEGCKDQP